MSGVRDSVRKALDDAFTEGVKGLYAGALARVSGGEPIDEAIKQFNAGILLEVAKLHARLLAEADATMDKAGVA
jgi:hypothetical protein